MENSLEKKFTRFFTKKLQAAEFPYLAANASALIQGGSGEVPEMWGKRNFRQPD